MEDKKPVSHPSSGADAPTGDATASGAVPWNFKGFISLTKDFIRMQENFSGRRQWADFVSEITQKGAAVADNILSYSAGLMDAMKNFHLATETSANVKKSLVTIFDHCAGFVEKNMGKFDASQWRAFLRTLEDDGFKLSGEAAGYLSEIVEALNVIYAASMKVLPGLGKTVLVVDDSNMMRMVVRRVLEGAGYSVVEAEDGVDALKRLEGLKVNMVITDLSMPNMDGIELVGRLRADKLHKFTPIVLLTAEENPDVVKEKLKGVHITAWLTKPFKAADMLSLLRRVAS